MLYWYGHRSLGIGARMTFQIDIRELIGGFVSSASSTVSPHLVAMCTWGAACLLG